MKANLGGQTALAPNAAADRAPILMAHGVRAFADGLAALPLPICLTRLSLGAFAIGAIVTTALLGTALLTLAVGLIANRRSRCRLLVTAGVLNRTILAQPAAGDCHLPATPDRATRR